MISRVPSSILSGIDAVNCEVEADVTDANEPIAKLVGMADTAVKESVSRIQVALLYRQTPVNQAPRVSRPRLLRFVRSYCLRPPLHTVSPFLPR